MTADTSSARRVFLPGTRRPRTVAERITPHRRRILALVAEGYTDATIGRRFEVSKRTIGRHLEDVCDVLGARNRTHAVVLAYRAGLICLDQPATPEARHG